MRTTLVAELATAHGGDLQLAEDMISAACDAGADLVKLQSYSVSRLNPADPQRDWLTKSHLDEAATERLLNHGRKIGIEVFSTPFDPDSLAMLRKLGLKRFKIASCESANNWWKPILMSEEQWIVSYAWGQLPASEPPYWYTKLSAIPLYPTPLECVQRATLLDGYSDHCEGIAACYWALAQGVKMLEVHMALAGRSRVTLFDKSPTEIRMLRRFSEDCETMRSGVAEKFRTRWSA